MPGYCCEILEVEILGRYFFKEQTKLKKNRADAQLSYSSL